jgi:AAA15 family ATPase/GTPase
MLNSITINGLRAIKSLKIDDLKMINVFVGNNNCGKTTVIEAIYLLINPGNPDLALKVNLFRGMDLVSDYFWKVIFNNYNEKSKIILEAISDNEKRELIISPILASSIDSITSNKKILAEDVMGKLSNSGFNITVNGLNFDITLSNINRKKQKQRYLKYKANIQQKDSGVVTEKDKNYLPISRGIFNNSSNYKGRKELEQRFSEILITKKVDGIIKILKKIELNLENIVIGHEGVIFCDIGKERMLPINVLGDGIFKLFSIVLGISDSKNGIYIFDEIENGLHYSAQKVVWQAIIESAKEYNTQIFLTTHSNECLKSLLKVIDDKQFEDNMRLFRIERDDDNTIAVKYSYEELRASIESDWEVR